MEERFKPWAFRRNPPHEKGVWKMFCLAIEVMVKKTMEFHDFRFDNKMEGRLVSALNNSRLLQ